MVEFALVMDNYKSYFVIHHERGGTLSWAKHAARVIKYTQNFVYEVHLYGRQINVCVKQDSLILQWLLA